MKRIFSLLLALLILLSPASFVPVTVHAIEEHTPVPILERGSTWSYCVDGTKLDGEDWQTPSAAYDTSLWPTGTAPIGFATNGTETYNNLATRLTKPAEGCYPSTYFKTTIQIPDVTDFSGYKVTGKHLIDDGVLLYVNGVSVYAFNTSVADAVYANWSSATVGTPAWKDFTIPSDKMPAFRTGENVITAIVKNANSSSSDTIMDFELFLEEAGEEQPDEPADDIRNLTMQPGSDESMMNFCWYSDPGNTSCFVQIAKKSDRTGNVFPDSAENFEGVVTAASAQNNSNEVTVTGLEASTEYVYRVGDGTHFSPVYSFTTRDAGSYSALLVGDPQIGSSGNVAGDTAGWVNTVAEAVYKYPDTSFILSAGDQVETSTSESQYDGFFSAPELTSIPLVSTIGNHDNNILYSYHYNSPNESDSYGTTSAGGDYWFTYGNTLYMVLNSNNSSATSHEAFIGEAILANADKDIKWKVVMFHHSIYSSASHSTDSSILNLRNSLYPVFDAYKIDVVLAGHDHCYTRSYQMLGGEIQSVLYDSEGRVVNPAGTLYITANSGSGSKYYDFKDVDSTYRAVRWQGKKPTYSNIEVTEKTFTISTYRVDNDELIDTYAIYKDKDFSGGTETNYSYLIRTLDEEIGEDHANPVFILDESDYTADSWSDYAAAIAAGIQTESNTSATQAEVDAARLAIIMAKAELVYRNSGDIEPYFITMQPGTDETRMNFSWATSEAASTCLVQIARTSDMINQFTFPDTAKVFTGTVVPLASDLFSNKAGVTGLEPLTEYSYRVGNGTHYTKVYTFKTKDPGSYNAIFVGDPQIGASGNIVNDALSWANTVTKALDSFGDTSFILSAGDQVDNAKSEEQYLGFFHAAELAAMPLVPTIGNHDNNQLYHYVFNSPNESAEYGATAAGGDYWFTYGNTLYMVLNSNNSSAGSHQAFIEEAISANSDKDIKWKVVMFHHSIYSSAGHSTEESIINLRNSLYPVFDENAIDVVLAGHDHSYTRSYQMSGGEAQTNQTVDSEGRVVNPSGTLYITANSASGSKYYDLQATAEVYAAVRQQLRTPTYSNVEVTENTFTISTYRVDTGAMVDTYTLYKGDVAALSRVDLTAAGDTLTTNPGESIKLGLTAKDGLGYDADLAGATVIYRTEPSDVLSITPDGTVTLQNPPETDTAVTVRAEVTVGGYTVSSNPVSINVMVGTIVSQVKEAFDDMEEWIADGNMDYNSSDLEIGWESPTSSSDKEEQLVGIRFADLRIPKGATILNAYIQFTVDEPNKSTDPFDIAVYAEDAANSTAFANVRYNISSRVRTSNFVEWYEENNANLWTVEHEAGEKQRTPNLASLVQEIADKDAWIAGNSISFILSGTGNRTAEAYDGEPTMAPALHITYTLSSGNQDQDAPTGLAGIAPTTSANSDGKITGTTADMEYRLSTDTEWSMAVGTEITGLAPGTYKVRYAAKEGYNASESADVVVPEYTGFSLTIGAENAGGAGYTRVVNIDATQDLAGKFLVVQFTEGAGTNAKVSVVMISATTADITVSYQTSGTKVDVWLVSGMPDLSGEDMNVQVYAYGSTN